MKKVLPFLVAILAVNQVVWGQTNEEADSKDSSRKRPLITNERYIGIGLGYIAGLSANAPYKAGVNLHDVFGFPLLHRRLVLEGQLDIDYRFRHNRDWNTRAYNGWRPSSIPGLMSCLNADFTLGIYPVIVNTNRVAAIVGPMVGIAGINARSASGDMIVMSRGFDFKFCYGLKASVFVQKHVMLSAQYFMTPITEADTATPAFPVTFNALRVGITYYRGPSTWWQDRKAKKKAAVTGGVSSQ